MAAPDRTVIAVMGDGAFQMSMMELATMRQAGVPVKLVVMKNGTLGMVREYQHYHYHDVFDMVELKGDPALSKIACLPLFLEKEESALLQVDVDPNDLAKF